MWKRVLATLTPSAVLLVLAWLVIDFGELLLRQIDTGISWKIALSVSLEILLIGVFIATIGVLMKHHPEE